MNESVRNILCNIVGWLNEQYRRVTRRRNKITRITVVKYFNFNILILLVFLFTRRNNVIIIFIIIYKLYSIYVQFYL